MSFYDEGTSCYMCSKCGKPCDPKPCEREFNREIIEQALIIIEKDGRSISNLQRKLNIGYTKAIRLLGAVDIELSVKKPNSEEDFCADCEAEPKPDGEKMTNEDKVAVKRYECDSMECGHKSCYDTNLLEEALAEKDKRIEANRLYGYRDGKKEMEDEVNKLKNELYRIRCVAERLLNSDDENEISLEENIAGKYMLKVLDGENFS